MTYRPTELQAPRLAGLPLRALVWLAESAFGGPLRRHLVKGAGGAVLGELCLDQVPASLPPIPRHESVEPESALALDALHAEGYPRAPTEADAWHPETIADFAHAYRTTATTPLDVAERVLDCTRQSEAAPAPLRCFIAQDRDDVLKEARQSCARLRAGEPRSVLEGVPIAVKDELDQVPYATTVGTKFLTQPAKQDSAVVERLRAAGALLIGKTNMHEIGIGVTGLNAHHGPARNPHDPSRITGGSSSGSAAAVAAGLCPAAVGADGGGSIRIPAALCGLVGLKPTFGRVSEYGAAPLCWSVAHLGPLANTALDAALLYSVIAGRDARDPNTLGQPMPHLEGVPDAQLKGMSIGIVPAWFEHADAEVVARCRALLDHFEQAGAMVHELELPGLEWVSAAHMVSIGSEMAAAHGRYFARHLQDYAHDVRLLFALIQSLPAPYYVTAQRVRALLGESFANALTRVDMIATPTTAISAPLIASDALETGESNLVQLARLMRFAQVSNLTGLPAISLPAGYTAQGLPVGLQLIGRPWHEHVLLGTAHAAQGFVARRSPRLTHRLLG
jgi:Asp-tRNA(Asn)/Glu-tRNA(Gln) amidotransferase A subunit family amidase